MKQMMKFNVNGDNYELLVDASCTLLEVLRDEMGLTGTKEGCDMGTCGTCTVIMNGKAVLSCLILAVDAQEKEILTIEGLAEGEKLHPIQTAFIKHGAIQCGYCTPGMVMSAKALLDKKPNPSYEDVKKAISGNICRCTGYTKIVEAIQSASRP